MQLDWFTMAAQIVNFLILVALLKRFLYGPIIRAMDNREAHIAARLQEAEGKLATAAQQAALYQSRLHDLDTTRDTMLMQARADAEAQRQQLLEQARQDAQQRQARWRDGMQQERASFLHEFRQQAGQQVCIVVRQVLSDLASVDLEGVVVDSFLDRLQGADEEVRQTLAAAAHAGGVVVRSTFPMPSEVRLRLMHAIHACIGAGVDVQFATQPDLLCGIEVAVHGHKIAWNLAQYVASVEEHMDAILAQEMAVGTAAGG